MTESDVEFLKRIKAIRPSSWGYIQIYEDVFSRLLALAERGAKVPDEPTLEMRKVGWSCMPVDFKPPTDLDHVYYIYCAMLRTALGDKT